MVTKLITMVKGSRNVNIVVDFVDKNTGNPFSLAGFLGSTGYFPALDPCISSIAVSGSLVSSDRGQISFVIPGPQLLAMGEGEQMDWEQEVDLGSRGFVTQILSNLSIFPREFPPAS